MILSDDGKRLRLRRRKPCGFKIDPAEGIHPHAAHTALTLNHQPVVDQRHDMLPGQQPLAPGGRIKLSCSRGAGDCLPVNGNAALNQRDFVQIGEELKFDR